MAVRLTPEGPRFAGIEGQANLVRDRFNNVVLETDKNKILTARKKKAARLAKMQEIDELKQDVSEMKGMLKILMEKIDAT